MGFKECKEFSWGFLLLHEIKKFTRYIKLEYK